MIAFFRSEHAAVIFFKSNIFILWASNWNFRSKDGIILYLHSHLHSHILYLTPDPSVCQFIIDSLGSRTVEILALNLELWTVDSVIIIFHLYCTILYSTFSIDISKFKWGGKKGLEKYHTQVLTFDRSGAIILYVLYYFLPAFPNFSLSSFLRK